MNRIEVKPMKAEITIGLNKHYTKEKNTLSEVTTELSSAQTRLNKELNIQLSAKVTPCKIVFAGQDEESVTLSFINYPKFPIKEEEFYRGVEFIARQLMASLEQNRIVIEYVDKTVMFERSEEIDPNINWSTNKSKIFKIETANNCVEALSNFRIPLEDKGNDLYKQKRAELKHAIKSLSISDNEILVGKLTTINRDFFDVENILFYNLSTSTFTGLSANGIAMQRIEKALESPYTYKYQYCIESLDSVFQQYSAPSCLEFNFPVHKTLSSCKLIDYWSAIHKAADSVSHTITLLTGRFGVRVFIKTPVQKVNSGNIIKPLLDGIISAMHYQANDHPIPDILSKQHKKFLKRKDSSILGERRLVYDYRNGLMWNPQDELCTEAILIKEFDPSLPHPIIKAEIYSIDQ